MTSSPTSSSVIIRILNFLDFFPPSYFLLRSPESTVLSFQEVALDEDPDNVEAAHAVQILTEGLSTELPKLLDLASVAMEELLRAIEQGQEDGGSFWQNLTASETNPRALAAFLNQLVVSVCLCLSV